MHSRKQAIHKKETALAALHGSEIAHRKMKISLGVCDQDAVCCGLPLHQNEKPLPKKKRKKKKRKKKEKKKKKKKKKRKKKKFSRSVQPGSEACCLLSDQNFPDFLLIRVIYKKKQRNIGSYR